MNGKHTTILDGLTIHLGDAYGTDVEYTGKMFCDMLYEWDEPDAENNFPEYFALNTIRLMHPVTLSYSDKVFLALDTNTHLEYIMNQGDLFDLEQKVMKELREEMSYVSLNDKS